MDKSSRQLISGIILSEEVVIENDFKKLSQFNNVILAGKEDRDTLSGFSFLIIQYDAAGQEIFRGCTDEFQNANTIFVLRAYLRLTNNE